jgi:1,4-dihydroxy-6-naphthoate synthase
MSEIDLAISPCPNDTFIFQHLIQNGPGLLGTRVGLQLADVEELNRRAIEEQRHALTKLSFFAMSRAGDHYQLLENGGALGRGCGPLLISRHRTRGPAAETAQTIRRIVIPGRLTTANLLTHLYLADCGLDPRTIEFEALRYEKIIPALLAGEADFGVIIHEERFTYERAGLHGVQDLGQWWEDATGLPIPLGCIAARKDVIDNARPGVGLQPARIEAAIRQSIDFAYAHPDAGRAFIKANSQALEDEVIEAHIGLYVNEFSRGMGDTGRRAVAELFRRARDAGI